MKTIPFDINLRPEIENGRYKVEMICTSAGNAWPNAKVRIICWDMCSSERGQTGKIVGLVTYGGNESEFVQVFYKDGRSSCCGFDRLVLIDTQEPADLVKEESKHTEVWVEGRTIFEQEGEPTEGIKGNLEEIPSNVDLEKATEEYIEKRASLAPNESWDIEDIRAAVRFGAEWAFRQFSDILDKWEAHAISGMKVGASAYHQGKIALICDLRDWIKGQTKNK